jgi:hypothetical protein
MTRPHLARWTCIALLAALGACADGTSRGDAAPVGPAHAQEGVVPGSHADWCAEHEVAESRCTRCDATLVAAFKATGDWCAEHGLPESQCLRCDPGRKATRPAPEAEPR